LKRSYCFMAGVSRVAPLIHKAYESVEKVRRVNGELKIKNPA